MGHEAATAERDLVALLRLAYSGELGAIYAYRSHWRSLPDRGARGEERRQIQKIEGEELHHRLQLREMLRAMGRAPQRFREVRAWLIGHVLGSLCHVTGWLIPMYGAGRLESHNVREYEAAARHAWNCGRREWVDGLLTMAEVEWDHEAYFRARVLTNWLGRRIPLWPAPPPKETIRLTFERDFGSPVVEPSPTTGERAAADAPAPELAATQL